MLMPLGKEDIMEAAAFAHRLCGRMETASYPLPESMAAIVGDLEKGLESPCTGQTIAKGDGRIKGLMTYYVVPAEKYAQTTLFLAAGDDPALLDAMVAHLREKCPGYEVMLGFPVENERARQAMERAGFALLEASDDMRLNREDFIRAEGPSLTKITKEQFARYAPFHDAAYPGIYWNARRLEGALPRFTVFALMADADIQGSLFLTCYAKGEGREAGEIFGMHCGEADARGLLSGALERMFAEKPCLDTIIFFLDAGDMPIRDAATSLGFFHHCDYRCYGGVLLPEAIR